MKLNTLEKGILLLTCTLAIATCSAKAGAGVYIDSLDAKNGAHVLVAYDLRDHIVHLFMPDGRDIKVAYDPAIEKAKLDAGLQQIVDKEAARK
jgi:hypothetical protein